MGGMEGKERKGRRGYLCRLNVKKKIEINNKVSL